MADAQIPVPKAPPPRIVIIRKKKGGHGGHHGGAWKVAYADFVTAMMALFIVLWLMGSDKEVQEAIAGYFRDPTGKGKMVAMSVAGAGHSLEVPKEDMDKLREKIQQALTQMPNFRNLKDNVEVTITADGLRIELLETEAGMFFESGRPVPTETGSELLAKLAQELGKLPNKILLEGHTDSKPFSGNGSYTNWELSTDRANSARRLMQDHGLRQDQIAQVRGYADTQLRRKNDPDAASNRRISVIVQWLSPPPAQTANSTESAPQKPEAPKGH
jgi:chemotaxis protein MotB